MTDQFRKLSEGFLASPQITLEDIEAARSAGVTTIVNNRPEGEADDQTPGPIIEMAARKAGLGYVAIPISQGNFGEPQVTAMLNAIDAAEGKVLAYCRTGTRSTLLWALAQAAHGAALEEVASAAAEAGYDVSPVWSGMVALSERA